MQTRNLGNLKVSALGLGCMGMSEFYGARDEAESIAAIHRALELGVTLLDTADAYGPHTNEELVGRAIAGKRDKVVLATKFAIVRGPRPQDRGIDASPAYIRSAIEGSLRRLKVDYVDLYQSYGTSPNRQAVLGGNLSLFGYRAAEGCERGRLTEIEWLDDPAVCQR